MIVLKFGGTSMGSAERMINSAAIICGRADAGRVGVVVSAVAGVSNRLQESIDRCLAGKDPVFFIESLDEIHAAITRELALVVSGFDASTVTAKQQPVLQEYARLLHAVAAFGECPDSVYCRIMGMGEMLSAPMIQEIIRAKGYDIAFLDSRKFIITTGLLTEGEPDTAAINKAFASYVTAGPRILLMTGFVCSHTDGRTSLLGRNGSDFSAALMAMGLKAEKLEIWTDVDGIYTADPRIVPEAVLVDEMSYEEAMELSFFGSKVLHPKTITPLAANKIETWSLNSFNPDAKGTRIAAGPFKQSGPVRGITSLKRVTVVTVSGAGMKGKSGMAARIFSAVSRQSVSILLITQSSSEYTVTFCVRDSDAEKTKMALEEEFTLEQRELLVNPLDICSDRSIISIVGDGMREFRGLAATFFNALSSADINIHAIAQGYSERSISAVINGADSDRAVQAVHRSFFAPARSAALCIFGDGQLAQRVISLLQLQQPALRQQNIDISVLCIANLHNIFFDEKGIQLDNAETMLHNSDLPFSIDALCAFIKKVNPLNPVFVDCASLADTTAYYQTLFATGVQVVTTNVYANSCSLQEYHDVHAVAAEYRRLFLYESTAGAGMQVFRMLRNMIDSGDTLISFSAVVSGALSYIFGRMEDDIPFSVAAGEAQEKGLIGDDIYGCVSGMNAARQLLSLAREIGISVELSNVAVEPVLPPNIAGDVYGGNSFLKQLSAVDSLYAQRSSALKQQGKVLRHVVTFYSDGRCSAGVQEIGQDNPLYTVKDGENAFVLATKRYSPRPLVIRGYSSGETIAAGVFSDILRTIPCAR